MPLTNCPFCAQSSSFESAAWLEYEALTGRAPVYLMENAAGKDFGGDFVCVLVTSGDSMASHVAHFTLASTVAFGLDPDSSTQSSDEPRS